MQDTDRDCNLKHNTSQHWWLHQQQWMTSSVSESSQAVLWSQPSTSQSPVSGTVKQTSDTHNTGPVDSTILNCWPQQQQTSEAIMTDSEMSPKAKVTYDQHKFEVEFNVTEYLPEVSVSNNFHLKLSNIFVISALRYLNCLRHLWLQHYLCSSVTWWSHLFKLVIKMLQFI